MPEPGNLSLDELVHKCLHCGMCLPVCPTYNLTFKEESSPRGRIRMIKSVKEEKIPVSKQFVDEMYFCLDCQACETACPAGVQYGDLVEEARNIIAENNAEPFWQSLTKRILLKVLASRKLLRWCSIMLRLYQKSGLHEAVEQSALLTLVSQSLHDRHAMLPHISSEFFDEAVSEVISPIEKPKGRVGFLTGCIMNTAFAHVHHDAITLLVMMGYEVIIPKAQPCCGSLHGHNGERETARRLAKELIRLFDKYSFDILLIDAAGCSAFVKEYAHLLQDDPSFAGKAQMLSSKTKDILEFIAEHDPRMFNCSLPQRVTYHEACHHVHTQKISEQPKQLLRSIRDMEYIELPEATWCCGSAGIYNVIRYEDSMKVLDRKMNNIVATGAHIVVTGNPGCMMQLMLGAKRYGISIKVMHPVELLSRAYR